MLDGLGTQPGPDHTAYPALDGDVRFDVVNQYTQVRGVTRTHDNNGNLKDDGTYLFANTPRTGWSR